ncbi:MAG: ABC-type transport system, permease component [Akkermansiaceae bacterium]|nr:ABC-type transport system, permease component [Akkermansiaceae bacterium]
MNDTPPPPPSRPPFSPSLTPEPLPPESEQPPTAAEPSPLTGPLDAKKIFDALLRSPKALVDRLAEPGHGATGPLVAILLFSIVAYGIVLGSFAMGMQLWAAPAKIAAGLLISATICFPSLYIFFSLAGSRITAGHLASTMAAMLALGGLLLLGFAPAIWIFTQATDSFGFMGMLALAPWFVALYFGSRFLFHAARATGATSNGPIHLWGVIFLLVTLQMTTSLRPILGRSDRFLTDEKRFFLQHWFSSLDKELSGPVKAADTSYDAR